MPLRDEQISRKRKRSIEAAESQPRESVIRQKRSSHSRTPPGFWDNLSRVPLCRRALREFNRRVDRPVASKQWPERVIEGDLIKQLKRFARRGGPNLRNIRGVSSINAVEKSC
jgi:hypothetical protein